jgi:UDP-2-acetamido-2,6-beta-L-arabino-hexul-4-ose reductase
VRVAITGADGFIGKNLSVGIREGGGVEVIPITRHCDEAAFRRALSSCDMIFHLAGVNRPSDPLEFEAGNVELTKALCRAVAEVGRELPIVFASSRRAGESTEYGRTKAVAEAVLIDFARRQGSSVHIFRLPNVFGKWCRPNYNSAIATFCYNIAHDLPISIVDPYDRLDIVHIDDVVEAFVNIMRRPAASGFHDVSPVHATTVGAIAEQIRGFHANRRASITTDLDSSLTQALYATYLSYLPSADLSRPLTIHSDARGSFGEILKTANSGQFSFFTAAPGMTRGNHYHHRKAEKFLVVEGEAVIQMRHIISDERLEIPLSGAVPVVVDTVPGWCHNITNTGSTTLVVLLWASEVFDPEHPDTIAQKV